MAGVKGKSGKRKTLLHNQVYRIRVTSEFRDLVPFFNQLAQLPADRRNATLLLAIRGGAASAQTEARAFGKASAKVSKALDALTVAFDLD
jgi:hypothetical protein